MFFDLVSRNSKRNRKENSLFFSSMLISVIAFYLILSLSHQDVMLFLAKMESHAVERLLTMIPLFYGMSLVILFFLIYFASKYQLTSRKHEFGMYLMMGMRRYKLFFLLLAEDIKNSIIALVIGLPVAIVMSEIISLVTAKLVGIGIIGHRMSLSLDALVQTAVGFVLIKFLAFLILSGKIARQQIGELLVEQPKGNKKQLPMVIYLLAFVIGILLLAAAYCLAIAGMSWQVAGNMALTLASGFFGTLLIFFGIRCVMEFAARNTGKDQGLHTFTFRQLQEVVIQKSNTMAISSLLILAALCCFGGGVAIAVHYGNSEQHVLDYTFRNDTFTADVAEELAENGLDQLFLDVFEMRVGNIHVVENQDEAYSMESVVEQVEQMDNVREKESLLRELGYYQDYPYLISLSSYNHLLKLAGKPQLQLASNQAGVYMDESIGNAEFKKVLNEVFATNPQVQIAKEPYFLTGTIQNTNLVVDRSITLSFALIVQDDVFLRLTTGDYSSYINGVLSPKETEDKTLIQAVMDVNDKLNAVGISYESYLQNMGRQLFYVVAASYITIYLAIVFLIVANTIIGVQFLTQLQGTKRRYCTLIRIGASYQSLCYSMKKQIKWYFGIPVVVAALSSIFGIRALFSGMLPERGFENLFTMMLISMAMILLLCMVEYIYMMVVTKHGKQYLLSLMTPEREE